MNSRNDEEGGPGDCGDDPSCCPPGESVGKTSASCCGPGAEGSGGSGSSSRIRIIAFTVIIIAAVCVAAWALLKDRHQQTAGTESWEATGSYDLGEIAPGKEFAFVLLPGTDADKSSYAAQVVKSAAGTLAGQGVGMGFATIEADDPAYARLADSLGIEQFPAVVLMGETCGQSVITGEITEDGLLRSYLLATCGSICGPGGCGVSSGCCPQ